MSDEQECNCECVPASGFQAHSVVHAVMKQTDDDCCDTGATQSSGHQKTRRVHQSTERTPVTPMP